MFGRTRRFPSVRPARSHPGDIDDDRRFFVANCALCHGPEGDSVPGVEPGRGKFRMASNHDGLKNIIRKGHSRHSHATAPPQRRTCRVVIKDGTKDGTIVTGRLLNQDAFTVQLPDSPASIWSLIRNRI